MSSNVWKETLNIDGYQVHQYQQNKQYHLILTEIDKHKQTTKLEIQVMAWDRYTNVARLKDNTYRRYGCAFSYSIYCQYGKIKNKQKWLKLRNNYKS